MSGGDRGPGPMGVLMPVRAGGAAVGELAERVGQLAAWASAGIESLDGPLVGTLVITLDTETGEMGYSSNMDRAAAVTLMQALCAEMAAAAMRPEPGAEEN